MLEQVADRSQAERLGGAAGLGTAELERRREAGWTRIANRGILELVVLEGL
jgi:hypothetical protein